ncbi:MAG: hypothetical protein COA73_00350 [Candidatus Hydrogenedentota bacterium]|nr:MAG: hypothetical protein COA73_00350 [Candidatus Hydrogenedentota bacterium]
MSKELTIADVAAMLKVDEAVVTRMFDKGKLSGFRWGDSWRTTEEILNRDINILTDEARIESMGTERHRTRWDLTADEQKSISR